MRFRELLSSKPLAILLHGVSIEEFERRALEFAHLDFVYFSLNRFDILETRLLNPIGRRLDILGMVSPYAIANNIDRISRYLAREEHNYFLTSFEALVKYPNRLGPFAQKVLIARATYGMPGSNSLFVLLTSLIIAGARKIVLFGADGAVSQSASIPGIISTYYHGEILQQSRGGEGWNLVNDTEMFNAQYPDHLKRVCDLYGIPKLNIVNCSPNSHIQVFDKISYDDVESWYRGKRTPLRNKTRKESVEC